MQHLVELLRSFGVKVDAAKTHQRAEVTADALELILEGRGKVRVRTTETTYSAPSEDEPGETDVGVLTVITLEQVRIPHVDP